MEEGKKFPTGGHIVVDKVDGKPHICIQWEYEEENPPTVERQRDSEITSS